MILHTAQAHCIINTFREIMLYGSTDNPMKRLFLAYIDDIAPWLMPKQHIKKVSVHKIDLPISAFQSDHVFKVLLEDDNEILLHLEFEAHVSRSYVV
ncbi:MAG: hypothetical protein R2865_14775 [Deinococcales bacterium]